MKKQRMAKDKKHLEEIIRKEISNYGKKFKI